MNPECKLADGEVEWLLSHHPADKPQLVRNTSHLYVDHDVDANDDVTNTSTPRVIHIVRLESLAPATSFSYRVRSNGGAWSDQLSFRTLPSFAAASGLSLLITADVGAGSIPPAAVAEAATGEYDMHLHAGDMAYDMSLNHGKYGDQFFNELSAIASRIPFQAWPGNHETDDHFCDFLSFRARLANQNLTGDASKSGSSRYYSFDIPGLLHVAGIDTDAYAEPDYDTSGNGNSGQSFFVAEQYSWLENDLASVNRTHTPWVFLIGHHPMYCSAGGEDLGSGRRQNFPELSCRTTASERQARWQRWGDVFQGSSEGAATGWCYDCTTGAQMIREGCTNGTADPKTEIPSCGVGTGSWKGKRWGLETLMEKYAVDFYFTGHMHMYERSWPTLFGQVQKTYHNPSFPVHINTGNSGSQNNFFLGPEANFTAFRLARVGCYSSVQIHNATHLSFAQKSAANGTVIDKFDLVQERHQQLAREKETFTV